MSGRFRPKRVGDQLRGILAELLQFEAKDPEIGFVTITEVRMSPDLHYATVFVSVLDDEEDAAERSLAALRRAQPFLRTEAGRRLRLRQTPELRFKLDDTLAHSQRIESLLGGDDQGGEGDGNE